MYQTSYKQQVGYDSHQNCQLRLFSYSWVAFFIFLGLALLIAMFSIPGAIEAQGKTYYVAPTGDDLNNEGTELSPWRTIQKAADTLVAGETVYIMAGTYSEHIVPQNSGVSGNYITYTAYPGDVVTIDGDGVSISTTTQLAGLINIFKQSYIKISGFRVINAGQTDHLSDAGIMVNQSNFVVIENNFTSNTVSSGIGVWNSSDITVAGNEIEFANNGGRQECLTVATTNRFEVTNNHVHNNATGSWGGEGIDVKQGSANGVVSNNTVHDCKSGIYVDAWDSHTHDIEVFGNVVYGNVNGGIAVASEMGGLLENIKIYNNVSYDNGWVGIAVSDWSLDSKIPMKNIEITNNTVYNNGIVWGGGLVHRNPEAKNVIIKNNIFSQNLSFQIKVFTEVPVGSYVADYNLIDGYKGVSEEIYGDNYVEGDPKFYDPLNSDFHLTLASPCLDTGTDIGAPTTDFEGDIRPYDGDSNGTATTDIGADEWAKGGPVGPVPELPTVLMLSIGLLGLGGFSLWRRRKTLRASNM